MGDVNSGILIISILLTLIVGVSLGYIFRKLSYEKQLINSKKDAKSLVEQAEKDAVDLKQKSIKETKAEIQELKKDFERESKEKRELLNDAERRNSQRETSLDNRGTNLDRREHLLTSKEEVLQKRLSELEIKTSEVDELLVQQEKKLQEISGLNQEEAEAIVIDSAKKKVEQYIVQYSKEQEDRMKLDLDKKAKTLMANVLQKYASDVTSEVTVSVVDLPSDEMKGRIIGREGRNIRAFEALTGVDVIIDDTPEAVVISCFDPIRREVAKRSLETLIFDGRIHPARIEEVTEKMRNEVSSQIREYGENAIFELGITRMHPDLIKLIGSLHFRTSYGQNVLKHSIETAIFTGKLAAELGEDEQLAKRAGLLHDIGKAVDHEVEGSHVEIGVDLASKFKEHKVVIDGIASHHGEVEPKTIIGSLVGAADALSAARPGARSESIENYLKRIQKLEEISNSFDGVNKSFAVQAGREIRILVTPDKIDDNQALVLSSQIRERIENEMEYPGTIKITVIRETRATAIAK